MLLLCRGCLMLLLGRLTLLLLLLRCLTLLLLLRRLTLLLLRCLTLLLLLRILKLLLLLLRRLTLHLLTLLLLLLRYRLVLLLRCRLVLLLRSRLALLLLRHLVLLSRHRLTLLLLLLHLLPANLIASLHRRRSFHITIRLQRPVRHHVRRAALIRARKLRSVGAGSLLMLDLGAHRSSMLLVQRPQFLWPRTHLHSARPAVETHPDSIGSVVAYVVAVHIPHHPNVHIVHCAVVPEMVVVPVAALVAESNIAEAIVDAAVVADVPAPIAAVKLVAVVSPSPVARRPESALVRSLNPCTRHPVVAPSRPGPIAGRPQVPVTGSLWLVIGG